MPGDTSTPEEIKTNTGYTVAITAAYILVMVLVCAGSIAAAGFGVYRLALASPIVLHVGNFALSIEVTDYPDCSPLFVSCPPPMLPANSPNYLSVWGTVTTYNSQGQETKGQRILKLQIP
jgi:hypothetical protein